MQEVGAGVLLTQPAHAEDWTTAQRVARANPTAGPHIPYGVLFLLPHWSQPLKGGGHWAVLT